MNWADFLCGYKIAILNGKKAVEMHNRKGAVVGNSGLHFQWLEIF